MKRYIDKSARETSRGTAQVDNCYRVVRDKLNFATDGCKADGVDYCIVTRVILIAAHVKLITADDYLSLNINEKHNIFSRSVCMLIMYMIYFKIY